MLLVVGLRAKVGVFRFYYVFESLEAWEAGCGSLELEEAEVGVQVVLGYASVEG